MRFICCLLVIVLAVTVFTGAAPTPETRPHHITNPTQGRMPSLFPGSPPLARAVPRSESSQDIAPDDATLLPVASISEALELHADLTSAIGPGAEAEIGTVLVLAAQDNVTTGSSGTEDSESGPVIATTRGLRNGFGVVNLNMGGLMTLLAAALVGGVLAIVLGCSFTSLWYLRRMQAALDGMEDAVERMRKAQVEPCARPRLLPFADVCGRGLPPVPLSPLSQEMVQSPLESVYGLGRTSGKTANSCKVSFPVPRVAY